MRGGGATKEKSSDPLMLETTSSAVKVAAQKPVQADSGY